MSASAFTPGNLVALRLVDDGVQKPGYSRTAAVWLDELAPGADGNSPLRLVRSTPLPNGSSVLASGQYRLTMAGNDMSNLQFMRHSGLMTMTQDGQGLVLAGIDAPPGVVQAVTGAATGTAYSWTANGLSSSLSTHNIVVGTIDFNASVDVSTIAGLANSAAAGPFAFAHGSTGPCVPSQGAAACPGQGFLVDTNNGLLWAPYRQTVGFTGTTGTGSFYYYGSQITGHYPELSEQGYSWMEYSYFGIMGVPNAGIQTWPPATRNSVGFTQVLGSMTAPNTNAVGMRAYAYFVPVGQTTFMLAIAEPSTGLRLYTSAFTLATFSSISTAWTEQFSTYTKAPNNDNGIVGVTPFIVGGRTVLYCSSVSGSIYALDPLTKTWLYSGMPVFTAPGPLGTSTYRAIVGAPASKLSACMRLPGYSYNHIVDVGTNGGPVIVGNTSGAAYAASGAAVYSSVTYGCNPGQFGALVTRTCDPLTGWSPLVLPTCTPCTASAGFYCAPGSTSTAGVPCKAGFVCAGTNTDLAACTARAGYYCASGAAAPSAQASWTLCPSGFTCLGGGGLPIAVRPFNKGNAIVARMGDGVYGYGTATQPLFLDEYSRATLPWQLIQSVLLPVSSFSVLPAPNGVNDKGFVSLSKYSHHPVSSVPAREGFAGAHTP